MTSASAAVKGARHAEYGMVILALVAFLAGAAATLGARTRTVTHVRVTHPSVSQLLGRPDQQVAPPQGLGARVCDVYLAKRELFCHP